MRQKYIEPEDEEEDQLDNQVTARMSLEELFAAWDEEDALAERKNLKNRKLKKSSRKIQKPRRLLNRKPKRSWKKNQRLRKSSKKNSEDEEPEEISEEDILNLDSAEEWSDDELTDAFEENSDNKSGIGRKNR